LFTVVDQRTPVIVGVGQFTEHIDAAGYRGMSAVELATAGAGSWRTGGSDTTASSTNTPSPTG
jgi:acetyl-CoA C-acetyltransferase